MSQQALFWGLSSALLLSAAVASAEEIVPASATVTSSTSAKPDEGRAFLVVEPFADLRSKPEAADPMAAARSPYEADALQETQVIFGEEVRGFEEKDGWLRVEAVEQPEATHHDRWEGYPGWLPRGVLYPKGVHYAPTAVVVSLAARLHDSASKKSPSISIPLGARVSVVGKKPQWAQVQRPGQSDGWMPVGDLHFLDAQARRKPVRQSILETAEMFLGQPYFWGGRTPHNDEIKDRRTGVDCSALVNLSYRVNGVDVPRDAHEQYMKARPLTKDELKPGDLIFLAKPTDPQRMVHVMLFVEDDEVLEAVQEFNIVRRVTLKKKLGVSLKNIQPNQLAGDRFVFFGRLLPD